MDELTAKECLLQAVTAAEILPVAADSTLPLQKYAKMPLSEMLTLGSGMKPAVDAIRQITGGGRGGSGLYRADVPAGTHMAVFKDGSGYLGSTLSDKNNALAGQARFTPVPYDPTALLIAAVVANIDKKLDALQQTQQEFIDYTVQKDKSALKGDLDFLTDVFNNYKRNLSDEKFKTANHVKALDIRQDCGRRIDFYREQIKKSTGKNGTIRSDKELNKLIEKLADSFADYRLSLYLYGFAYFLEVLLQENYDGAYLNAISAKIERVSLQYRELYSNVYTFIEERAKTTMQSKIISGLSAASNSAGEAIAKIPVISKSQLDENLIETGKKLSALEDRKEKAAMFKLIGGKESSVRPFVEQINNINRIYNSRLSLMFDNDNIYLETEE